MQPKNFKPTKDDLANAVHKGVDDSLDYGLEMIICGINPGLYSGATGWPYARPGNRFWKALYLGGITDRIYHPSEYKDLKKFGIGFTNIVARTTNAAAELSKEEIIEGSEIVKKKVEKFKPEKLVILGLGAYKIAFNKKAVMGLQKEKIGDTEVYVLPNPSGLNASYTAERIGEMFRELFSK